MAAGPPPSFHLECAMPRDLPVTRSHHPGATRREALQVGGLSLLALSLPTAQHRYQTLVATTATSTPAAARHRVGYRMAWHQLRIRCSINLSLAGQSLRAALGRPPFPALG